MPGNVAIIGGGIAGLTSAYFLSEKGVHVTLFERAKITTNTSTIAAGMLAPLAEGFHQPELFPLLLRAYTFYDEWLRELNTRVRASNAVGLLKNGALFIDSNEETVRRVEEGIKRIPMAQYRVLQGKELHELCPKLSEKFQYGIHYQPEASLNPELLIRSIFDALVLKRIAIHEFEPVLSIESSMDSVHIRTPKGRYSFDQCIISTGYSFRDLYPEWADKLYSVRGVIFDVSIPDVSWPYTVHTGSGVYQVPRLGFQYVIGTTSEEKVEDHRPELSSVTELLQTITSLYESGTPLYIESTSLGFRPTTPDHKPILAPMLNEKIWVYNGLYRHGILLGPFLAKILTDWMVDGVEPPQEFRSGLRTQLADQ